MVTSLAKLGSCVVQAALDASNSFSVESFWRDQTCVIAIFRRFGCKFCRLEALNLSQMKPAFDKRRIRLVGISFDENGIKDFVDGNFFKGELFLDPDRSTYRAMDFKRVSSLSGFKSLFTKAGRDLNSVANVITENFHRWKTSTETEFLVTLLHWFIDSTGNYNLGCNRIEDCRLIASWMISFSLYRLRMCQAISLVTVGKPVAYLSSKKEEKSCTSSPKKKLSIIQTIPRLWKF
ncbi:hypothetical protein CRM22_006831 [Opisthorchis felineus]|uniref:Uncharacterized protein n=1 Tax=Opisthorchis felineus TaxID=147828 RepID=A0A4S2LJD1_OPIFE|nr:hypothetical protein CRM22_006831 [Opisthorchis felineus]